MKVDMGIVAVFQAICLTGAIIGGIVARRRRQQLDLLNKKLREINSELRSRLEDDSTRNALERTLGQPAAAHPFEEYGTLRQSLARARQQISRAIETGRAALRNKDIINTAQREVGEALILANDIKDLRAQRSLTRLSAKLNMELGNARAALEELKQAHELCKAIGDGETDILGELGDVYAELYDFEQAAYYYDACMQRIQDD